MFRIDYGRPDSAAQSRREDETSNHVLAITESLSTTRRLMETYLLQLHDDVSVRKLQNLINRISEIGRDVECLEER